LKGFLLHYYGVISFIAENNNRIGWIYRQPEINAGRYMKLFNCNVNDRQTDQFSDRLADGRVNE
jgi:hypothetical protein